VLGDVFLQDIVRHPERLALWIEVLLLPVVAVVAIQVAEGAGRFDEDLEFASGFRHRCCGLRSWPESPFDLRRRVLARPFQAFNFSLRNSMVRFQASWAASG
jgi:hypothetical protein